MPEGKNLFPQAYVTIDYFIYPVSKILFPQTYVTIDYFIYSVSRIDKVVYGHVCLREEILRNRIDKVV
jgi:hypothetical protein